MKIFQFDINDKNQIREKNNLIKDAFYIGSFQRTQKVQI